MVVTASPDTYHHIIDYGMRKVTLRVDRLLLQAFMAGVYVGIAGNACIGLAGGYPTTTFNPDDPASFNPQAIPKSLQKFIYAAIFPMAFIAIIFTGAELFTGNTMTMLICWFEKRITIFHLLINWVGSFIGNWLGTLFSAYIMTYLCCTYDKEPYFSYLEYTAHAKVSYGWGSCFLRGVGCNVLVCLAVWNVTACDDAAGKIMALWFPIVAFVCAGYEHIIANLYTLQLCAMLGVDTSLGSMIVDNLIPTFLGNIIGGCILIGTVYWYNFYPLMNFDTPGQEGSQIYDGNSKAASFTSISRAQSRVSVSTSLLGLGPKQIETFGGTQSTWNGFDANGRSPFLTQNSHASIVGGNDPMFPRCGNINIQETAAASPIGGVP